MIQQDLLSDIPPLPERTIAVNRTVTVTAERKRLGGQNGRILDMLRCGPVTNAELARIALKYTSRLSDIRSAGYNVVKVSQDHHTGLSVYELQEAK